ncbi:MAG: FAD-dependent oxidoreductase [Candidatus Thorarchaeota archaeon]|nr:MAG: FAD-dependent oxidoreductase [Candidatus Thorarchaeota archaeon]
MVEQIVVVGCGAAGATAAMQARKLNRKVEITVFNTEPYSQYSRCGLPYTISGKVREFDDLVLTPPENWAGLKIDAKLATTVNDVDSKAKTVTYSDSESMEYDALVIATGAENADPPIKGLDKERVYGLRTMDDAKVLATEIGKSKKAVVIGGGLIGMEAAEAFHEKGLDVTVVEFLPNILLAMIDPDMAALVEEHCKEHGLEIVTNTAAQEILGDSSPEAVRVQNRETNNVTDIPVDFVVVATGVRPVTDLAEKAGAEIGRTRGIVTDNRMMTSVPDIYACGDCAENPEFITRMPSVSGLGTIAVRQARVAGMNAAGGDVTFPGIVGAKVTKLFGMEIASTGLTGATADGYGVEVTKGSIKGSSKPPYYVGGKDLKVKTYFDKATAKLVGGQIIGLEDAAMRINVITLGIQHDIDVADLFDFENCYAPAICDTWDPIVTSADAARRRLKR